MKVALICPSNMLYMPYVYNYIKILDDIKADYSVINWDRFKIEKENEFTYRDSKIGHRRNFLDYLKYCKFVLRILSKYKYDKIIVFGIQLVFFLNKYLIKDYSNRYIIDIRDYHGMIKYFNIEKVIEKSNFTVISSPGYKEWLPESDKYVTNHNTQIQGLKDLVEPDYSWKNKKKISIAYIGAIRDYKINIDFINSLKNSDRFDLYYHGEGDINKDIQEYLIRNDIKNVHLTGRYQKEDEESLYLSSDLANVLIPNDTINSKTLLPNRLYNAVKYGKPILALKGTYLCEQIEKYNLGIIVDTLDNVAEHIDNNLNNYDMEKYEVGRRTFFERVIKDNNLFYSKVIDFCTNE